MTVSLHHHANPAHAERVLVTCPFEQKEPWTNRGTLVREDVAYARLTCLCKLTAFECCQVHIRV